MQPFSAWPAPGGCGPHSVADSRSVVPAAPIPRESKGTRSCSAVPAGGSRAAVGSASRSHSPCLGRRGGVFDQADKRSTAYRTATVFRPHPRSWPREVDLIGGGKLIYSEGDKQTTCTIEYFGKGPILGVVYLSERSDCSDPPFDKVKMSDEDWKRIGDNIRDAYRSEGFEVQARVVVTSPEEREAFRRALEQLKRPSAASFAARCFAPFKRALEQLKRTLSQHEGRMANNFGHLQGGACPTLQVASGSRRRSGLVRSPAFRRSRPRKRGTPNGRNECRHANALFSCRDGRNRV